MKRLMVILLLMIGAAGFAHAQQTRVSENLTRNVVMSFYKDTVVRTGEFQMELLKGARYNDKSDNPWFSFNCVVYDSITDIYNIFLKGKPLIYAGKMDVRTYRIGPTYDKCIFVLKNAGDAMVDRIGVGQEIVLANGHKFQVCDSVLCLDDDGYVYSLGGRYYHCKYSDFNEIQTPAEQIFWEGKKMLVRDQYMPYSVLVVNEEPYELFDVYDDDDLRFKFSYNGLHWMAVGKECYWIDGVMKSVKGYVISEFAVNNSGNYGYSAHKQDDFEEGETVMIDGKVVCQKAQVCYFGLNENDDFKFRFLDGNRCYQYEYGTVTDVTDEMASVYYPGSRWNKDKITVCSADRSHKLTCQSNPPAVMVDGVKVSESFPCSALFDERNSAFLWSAVESRNGKTELVIYKYDVPEDFFKKLFN